MRRLESRRRGIQLDLRPWPMARRGVTADARCYSHANQERGNSMRLTGECGRAPAIGVSQGYARGRGAEGRGIRPSQRALLRANEVQAGLSGADAEMKVMEGMANAGPLTPKALVVGGGPICPLCAGAIEESGGVLVGPLGEA